MIVAIIEGPQRGWGSPLVLLSGVAASRSSSASCDARSASPTPLIEDDTRRDPRLRWGAAVITALFFGVIGMQFVLTQWIQGPEGYDALAAGSVLRARPR